LEKRYSLSKNDALIVTDIQNDFLSGGALPVPEGNKIIPILNEYIRLFTTMHAKIYATRDWHPPNHMSFQAQGGPWPAHCIQDTEGAKFHPDLNLPADVTVISKAMAPNRENYSSFDDTVLVDDLRINGIARLFVGGLATDYCVKNTVLDGLAFGFEVVLLSDAARGINVKLGDVEKAVEAMTLRGAEIAILEDFTETAEIPTTEPVGESIAEKPLTRAYKKKKARLRSRGPYRKARTER
jgi:nicotinamidase/pyrazinamidase